ncbi:hypothetical protein RND71_031043 [Anisodus tanguticus]|uniref:Uncharacterized protein n=1 Tax=Anisodus tanguticus TaxID=243964 RepID=A0AAE1V8V0_9SOLA|nr:hypothetical protein RND71_031043 [Anisodus tanguticus]
MPYHYPPQPSPPSILYRPRQAVSHPLSHSLLVRLFLYANPTLLNLLAPLVSISALSQCLTGRTLSNHMISKPRIYTSWFFLISYVFLGIARDNVVLVQENGEATVFALRQRIGCEGTYLAKFCGDIVVDSDNAGCCARNDDKVIVSALSKKGHLVVQLVLGIMDQISIPTIDFRGGHNHLQECGRNELINNGVVDPWFELDSEDLDSLYSVFDLKYQENNTSDKQVQLLEDQQQNISDHWTQGDDSSNMDLPLEAYNKIQPRVPRLAISNNNNNNIPSEISQCGVWGKATKDMELVHLFLAAAEEVDQQQFHLASQSIARNPIQRLCFYFGEALQERIDREIGRSPSFERKLRFLSTLALGTTPESLTCHQEIPFGEVMKFAGVQAVIENVKGATKIHLVDFNIRTGIQCTGLMQALAEQQRDCPIELLKITVIGHQQKEKIKETGKRLQNLRVESVNVKADETVAVYCYIVLRTMICMQDYLDNTIRVIIGLRPSVVVVCEVEASHNSPSFFNRSVDALFFYSVFFDCFEDCMDRENLVRKRIEVFHIGEGIRNIIAAEDAERFTRNVKLDVWRAYFARFGMVEMELSESSWYQANLISHGSSCSVQNDEKALLVGWKGTPIESVSIWKFL